jgi:hypothetical protein
MCAHGHPSTPNRLVSPQQPYRASTRRAGMREESPDSARSRSRPRTACAVRTLPPDRHAGGAAREPIRLPRDDCLSRAKQKRPLVTVAIPAAPTAKRPARWDHPPARLAGVDRGHGARRGVVFTIPVRCVPLAASGHYGWPPLGRVRAWRCRIRCQQRTPMPTLVNPRGVPRRAACCWSPASVGPPSSPPT